MDALWLEQQKLELRRNIPKPEPTPGEGLIRVKLAGVCSTDLELLRGYYPYNGIPGHEFVGEVVEAPSDSKWVGKRVVGEINVACGQCRMCLSGIPRHCERRRTLGIHDWNGVFAEYVLLPLANLHELPSEVSDQSAVFTEPVAAAYEILEQVKINRQDKVLLIGAGRLGQLVAQVLQTVPCNLTVVARHQKQQALLAARDIHTISETELGGILYDVVIEATGTLEGFMVARQSVRPRGTIILKSTYKGDVKVDFSGIVVDEINLIGSRCGPFEPALQLLKNGRVTPLPLIEATYPLVQGLDAFEHARRPGALKILIQAG
jgi:threonine dehydrogenase-like Zn-dependent dehydrogenase